MASHMINCVPVRFQGTDWLRKTGGMPRFGAESPRPADRFDARQTGFRVTDVLETRGTVSPAFRQEVAKILQDTFTPDELRLLDAEGYRFICAETVDVAVKSAKLPVKRIRINPFENAAMISRPKEPDDDRHEDLAGLFFTPHEDKNIKWIIFAEYFDHSLKKSREPNPDVEATVAEEVSHAIDHLYRTPSDEEAFIAAYRQDLAELSDEERQSLADKWVEPLNRLDSRAMRSEIFASLLATFKQHRALDRGFPVPEKFPRARRFVVEDFLPGRDDKYPVRKPVTGPIRIPIKGG